MNNSLDPKGLWMKARLFINRALDRDRDFGEQAFWACSSLELLGKSALANISPMLIANPADDGSSLLVASGAITGRASTVPAKAVWSRCERAFKPFSMKEAKKLSFGRNEYIHAAGQGFDSIRPEIWWQHFWSQAIILIQYLGKDLEEFVDAGDVEEAKNAINARKDNLRRQYEARLSHASRMLERFEKDELSASEKRVWNSWTRYSADYQLETECPACGRDGLLYGDEVIDTDIEESPWYPEVTVTLLVSTDAFDCEYCHIELYEEDLLHEAKIDETFEVLGDGDDIPYEQEYNNE